jgi:predicted MFS family arabinose efflux permease
MVSVVRPSRARTLAGVTSRAFDPPRRLVANRSFTFLWGGSMVAGLGSTAMTVAMPLLVLSLTHSAAKAGIVGFTRWLAFPLTTLPAGVLADRYSRRGLMAVSSGVRALAMGSVVLALVLGQPPFAQLILVAFVAAGLESVYVTAERGLLAAVVPSEALPDAIVANEARNAIAVVGGPPLGGALFGLARSLPFIADALSLIAAGLSLFGVRPQTEPERTTAGTVEAIREGFRWLWRIPFLRIGSILYAGGNVTFTAGELLVVLIARHHGASSAAIGLMFAVMGSFGLLGALIAGRVRRRLSPRWTVLWEMWTAVVCVPLLLLAHSPLLIGAIAGTMVLPIAASSSVVVGTRLTLAPAHLHGRVQATGFFLSVSLAWLGPLVTGLVFEVAGQTGAVLVLAGWTLLVAGGGTLARGLRRLPTREEAAAAAASA